MSQPLQAVAFADPTFGENCYLMVDRELGIATIVDPGMAWEEAHRWLNHERLTVDGVLLTHGHVDHVFCTPEVHDEYPLLPLHLPAADHDLANQTISGTRDLTPLTYTSVGEGDTLALMGGSVEVLATPGHTPGSVVYRRGDILLSGDTLFRASVGRTDLPGGSWDQLVVSVRRLYTLPRSTVVLPGHGEPTSIGEEASSNPFVTA